MRTIDKLYNETVFIKYITLFFGIFLLCTDVFFLTLGIIYDMPLMRYLIYVKLVINSTNLFLILNKQYLISTLIIYLVILAMMIIGIICLGVEPEFQLYALGMLVCISYNNYLHKRVLNKQLPMFAIIAIHVISYVIMFIYARTHEPLYHIPRGAIDLLIVFNSVASFFVVIIYVCLYYYVASSAEEKLEKMAMIDNLTGLYNRHYLLASLEGMNNKKEECFMAILDIDDFKKVNDTYGHNCGDYVLHRIAEIIQEICDDCIICRW
ncbi:MAG: GGDEF domain-containing protein, partial [Lachnospiraceae bacterium]|nr:GGDEF domain-containing protein [Lachnospiraceae bacterium]